MKIIQRRAIAGFLTVVMLMSIYAVTAFAADTFIYGKTARAGDINGDENITSADARLVLRIAAGLSSGSSITLQFADADGNGKVAASDARATLRVSANLDDVSMLAEFEVKNNGFSSKDDYMRKMSVCTGDSLMLEYFILRGAGDISWRTSNPAAVTVDDSGSITAIEKGFSCVIVTNGNETFYYEVSVKSELQLEIDKLRNKYPDGYYWNNHTPSSKYPNVTETPCDDHESGKYEYCKGQCAGFASLLFNEVFGYGDVSYGVTWDTVEVGDYLRMKPHHSVFVIDVVKEGDVVGYDYYTDKNVTAGENYIVVAHCNWGWNCNIVWDEIFTPAYEIDSSLSYSFGNLKN